MLLFFLLTFLTPKFAFAQDKLLDCKDPVNAALATCKAEGLSVSDSLATVIQFLFVIAVILALGFLIYGGIRWITSGGDKTGVATARGTIIASIIGLIVVFLAYVIVNLVLTFLTGSGIGGITIPTLGRATTGCGTSNNPPCFDGNSEGRPAGCLDGQQPRLNLRCP